MKKKIILTSLFAAASMLALASCGENNVASSDNQSAAITSSENASSSSSSSSITNPSSSSTTAPQPSSSSSSSKDDTKEKYVTFKVMDSDGTWKDLTNPALISGGKIENIPEAPKKDYYTFRGWYLDTNYEEVFVNENLNSSITVYAYYVADEVRVIFNGKDMGVKNLADVINDTYDPGEGLTFDGWYTNAECSVKFKAGDPAKTLYARSVAKITFNNGYEDVYTINVVPKTALGDPKTSTVTVGSEEKSFEEAYIVKEYMSSEDIYYVDENGNEIDFTKAVTKNTTIKVLWKSPFLGYTKSPNSEDLYVSGANYGDTKYYAKDKSKIDINSAPVISIPSKITVEDESGNKVQYNVVSAYFQDSKTFNSTVLKKIIVQEGIGYIRGFSSSTGISSIESVELPSTLRIIQNCFNNINGLTKDTVVIPSGVEAIYDSFWSNVKTTYNGTQFNSGKAYDFDINIPDSVRSLSIVPMNFKFSSNSTFVNDGTMIYQNTNNGKVLVSYNIMVDGTITVPEGVNGIQVGAFVDMSNLKTLVLPESFSFINYNLDLNDYKYCYVWNKNGYTCDECYLYTNDLSENDFAYNARMIVTTLADMDYVVFNSEDVDASVYKAIGGNTAHATSTGVFTYADNELYKDVKVVNVAERSNPTVNVEITNDFTGEVTKLTISKNNSDTISIDEILKALDDKNGSNTLQKKNDNILVVVSLTQFGDDYDLATKIKSNLYLKMNYELVGKGYNYEVDGEEVTITSFDQTTAIDLGNGLYGVTIPDEIDGKKVTKIADGAFEDCTNIQSIKLSANIKYIGSNAFNNCIVLSSINFNGAKLETIGSHAFENINVTSMSFATANLKSVGAYAFKIQTLKEFIPVESEKNRNEYTISDGEFFFGSTQLSNLTTMTRYTSYVSLLQKESYDEDNWIINCKLYAYANAADQIVLGNNGADILSVEIMEGAVSYLDDADYVIFTAVHKIHTNAFTDCEIYEAYYVVETMNVNSISTLEDLVSALPDVFENDWMKDCDLSSIDVYEW